MKKKSIISIAVVGVMLLSSISAFAANVGGGVWDYGTTPVGLNQKKVWSNYNHPSKKHKASCMIGTAFFESDWKNKKLLAKSSGVGGWFAETHAYYNTK